ncbi:MAG: hypothetical protein ACRBCT_05455 [Alphaproteobacteria bacterium]
MTDKTHTTPSEITTTENQPVSLTDNYDDSTECYDWEAPIIPSNEELEALRKERRWAVHYSVPEDTDHAEILVRAIRGQAVTPLPKTEKAALEHQAKMLDLAFRRLLADADTTYTGVRTPSLSLNMYAAAFQAQNQYRQTVKMLSALKSRGAYKKKGHKKNA